MPQEVCLRQSASRVYFGRCLRQSASRVYFGKCLRQSASRVCVCVGEREREREREGAVPHVPFASAGAQLKSGLFCCSDLVINSMQMAFHLLLASLLVSLG